jgi:hypothetical protein
MSSMNELIHGVIHGKTVELETDPGLSDGQAVEVLLRPASVRTTPGDGIRRSAGALADDPYWDAIMDEVHQARKQERRSHGEPV